MLQRGGGEEEAVNGTWSVKPPPEILRMRQWIFPEGKRDESTPLDQYLDYISDGSHTFIDGIILRI